MFPELLQFLAFYLLVTAFLKIGGSWLQHNYPGSALAHGTGWFVPGLAQ